MDIYVLSSWDRQNCHIMGIRGVYSSLDELKSALMQGLDASIFNFREHVVDPENQLMKATHEDWIKLLFSNVAIEKFKLDEWRS